MESIPNWWIWMALAAFFLIGEIFTAGFFLMWFSFGAAAAGVLDLLGVESTVGQIIVFMVVSGILYVFGRRFSERVTVKQPPGTGADRFTHDDGVVIEEIDNAKNTGRIRIGQDEWRATSETGEVISEGAIVHVSRIDGTHAIVTIIGKGV